MNISEFQLMMRRIYCEKDSRRGAQGTINRLSDEVEELQEAVATRSEEAISEELADVLAWLASLANIIGMDLERAATRKYDNACPRCASSPCKCVETK